jgi:hypothetical protein
MKNILTTIALVLSLVTVSFSQTRTFVKTLDVKTATFSVDIPNSEITVKSSSQNYLSMKFTIELENGSESVLGSLCKTTRYDVKVIEDVNNSIIVIPNLSKIISISGVKLVEKITVEITAPYGVIMKPSESDNPQKNDKLGI